MGRIFHLGGLRAGLNVSVGSGRFSLGGRGASSVAVDPYAAHIASLQAIDPSGSYYTAQDYTASLSQAGLFVDAFGGALTYTSPNVMASPTRVVDATSGMAYASSDGADDTAIGSEAETVDTYTAVCASPASQTTWESGSVFDAYNPSSYNNLLGIFNYGSADYYGAFVPRGVRRNGSALPFAYDLTPITQWMVVTVQVRGYTANQVLEFFGFQSNFAALHLACLRKWPAAPSAAVVAATEQELASYYGPLIATNPV